MTTAMASASPRTVVPALVDALRGEVALLHELVDAVHRQRAGVAANDVDAVHASTGDMGRLLAALAERRHERARLIGAITGNPASTLEEVEARYTDGLTDSFALARNELRRAALETAREVSVNHHVLENLVAQGEVYLQSLFATATATPDVYRAPDAAPPRPAGAGVLFDRTA